MEKCWDEVNAGLTIGSAELYQGQEKSAMIISTVCSENLSSFVQNKRVRSKF